MLQIPLTLEELRRVTIVIWDRDERTFTMCRDDGLSILWDHDDKRLASSLGDIETVVSLLEAITGVRFVRFERDGDQPHVVRYLRVDTEEVKARARAMH